MESDLSEKNALIWTANKKEIRIKSVKKLLDVLINIKQESIDLEIDKNKAGLIQWVEKNFPKNIELIAELKSSVKEFTPQQFRENLIRILRKIT